MGGLQKLGEDGWELTAIESHSAVTNAGGGTSGFKYIFKRKHSLLTEEVKDNIQSCEDEIRNLNIAIENLNKEIEQLG